jgi:5-(aminomethyl)-3-furanmethanol phosphate kinase
VIVLKLGGSLAEGDALRSWLDAVSVADGGTVIVPGGGAFADTVRREQRRLGFSERAAHRMALLAMEQYGEILVDLMPALATCRTIAEMRRAASAGRVAVWLPAAMALADRSIPESWDVTSDSLAAWLARRLGAHALVLVKSAAAPRPLDPAALAAQGLVDSAFPRFTAARDFALEWVGPGEAGRLRRLLAA